MIDWDTLQSQACQREDCPSDFVLEQYHLKELSPLDTHEVKLAVSSCPGCIQRLDIIEQGQHEQVFSNSAAMLETILNQADSRPLQSTIVQALEQSQKGEMRQETSLWSRLFRPVVWVPILAAGAAVLAVSIGHQTQPTSFQNPDGIRMKGQSVFRVYRLDGLKGKQVNSGHEFKFGDRLRFEVTFNAPKHLMVVGREGDGTVYSAFPLGGEKSVRFEPGTHRLPGAVELDDKPGSEVLYAVVCDQAFDRNIVILDPSKREENGCERIAFHVVKGP